MLIEFLKGTAFICCIPFIVLAFTAFVICICYVWSMIIKTSLIAMSFIEQLWGGTMFLGFASYHPHDSRWYRDETNEWCDRQQEFAELLRPSIKKQNENIALESTLEYKEAIKEIDVLLQERPSSKESIH